MQDLYRARYLAKIVGLTSVVLSAYLPTSAQSIALPDAPLPVIAHHLGATSIASGDIERPEAAAFGVSSSLEQQTAPSAPVLQPPQSTSQTPSDSTPNHGEPGQKATILPQQKRVFGLLTNFTSVSGGTKPKPAGWKTDSEVAWKQSSDYSAIGFSVITSLIAYGEDSHPSLDVESGGNAPEWAYIWRGLADKTDSTLQGSLLFPALLHQDTRYYAMGTGSKWKRTLHAIAVPVEAYSYSGRPVFNVAGLLGKAGAQAVSTTYYPANSEDFGVLAEKFVYACLRQSGFTVLKEFSPDLSQKLHLHVKGSD